MNYELKEYGIGELIGKAFNIYFSKFFILVAISIVMYAPFTFIFKNFYGNIFNINVMSSNPMGMLLPTFKMIGSASSLSILVSIILTIVTVLIVSNHILKKQMPASKILSISLSKFFPVLGVIILTWLVVMAGLILFIVPGIIWMLMFCLASVVVVIENKSPVKAMKRSAALTKGSKGSILGLFILMGIIIAVIQGIIEFAALWIVYGDPQFLSHQLMQQNFEVYSNWAYLLIDFGADALLAPIGSILIVLVYFNQRVKKEGFNVEHLAKQIETPDTYEIESETTDEE